MNQKEKALAIKPVSPSPMLILFGLLLLGLFWLWNAHAVGASEPDGSKGKKIKVVVIIRYRIAPHAFKTVVKGLKRALRERGYREDRDVKYIDVLTPTADMRSIPVVLDAVRKHLKYADAFVTCGWISMYARTILRDTSIPQFFAPVLKSVALKMLKSVTAPPETNLSGVYLMYPPEKLLRIARLILPTARTYGYIYDSEIPADMVFKTACEGLAPGKRHGFDLVYLDIAQGAGKVIEALRADPVDVYGGIVGAFKNRGALSVLNIPMVTAFTLDIEKAEIPRYLKDDNTVAGLFNPFNYCGREVGKMIADIFDGKTTIQETVPQPALQIAFVNLRAARRLGIYIPFKALEAVDLVIK